MTTATDRPWLDAQGKPRASVDLAEAAAFLGRSPRHVRRMIAQGLIPAWQLVKGGPWRVDRVWLLGS